MHSFAMFNVDKLDLVYANLSSLIVKQASFAYVNHARIRFLNQPVISKEGTTRLKDTEGREPLMGLELTTDRL